ncbi:PPE family protein [Mycobacterium marinum]|uniref:PPE family protein n=1 Tax=Mycobacterium marinum TaxID=1781 RepID=UPI001595045F|nr:PPE family protein [Mycobacterium marinum]MDC8981456.1 PPE family protein [Mycobacterium marinum]MDC8996479.1 PPE family protein [Mycobacterium marinum]MDC8998477.1 PPE family protein [Mycobacterium marinum]MDC9009197.1 PPE family protein [Mycobacterium marinum]MDC9015383.1 PPE family protein [Mycobacterium marinum]
MMLDFAWLPPEINSTRIFSGAGSAPLFAAASAWEGLAQDLYASASSFDSVVSGLSSGSWSGPASVSMAAAAAPYVGWLSAAAGQAESAANQARTAATAFEAALSATVHPAAVTANRMSLVSLVATNILGQNTPAIAANEFDYLEMWAQDVAAMVGYHGGASSVAAALVPFSLPPVDLAGLASQIGTQAFGMVTSASSALATPVQSVMAAVPTALTTLQSLPLQDASMLMYPFSMAMSPLMNLMSSSLRGSTAGVAGATAAGIPASAAKLVDAPVSGVKAMGGAGLGSSISAGLGKARMVGAVSVPPTWEGSMPTRMASSAMSGLGAAGVANEAEMAAAGRPAGMPMMPMPMGAGAGAGGGMPGGMLGRGGASPNPIQSRPSVVPRTGIG